MRSKWLLTLALGLFLCGFKNNQEFTRFYDVYVQDVVNALTGSQPSPGLTGVQKFNNQYFTLWLSPTSSEQADLPTYYKQVVSFCASHNIRKVIWYLGYTNAADAAFYDPTSTDPNSFVQLLQNTPLPSQTQIEFRIECASMNNGSFAYSGSSPAPAVPTHVTLPNYMVATHFYNCLWWARDMFNVIPDVTLISGVTVDPQNNCTSDLLPYTTVSDANQSIVNYLDEFASINSDFYPLERGMTFDGSAKVQIFGNRASIPITDTLLTTDTDTILHFYNGDGNGYAPWTRPNPAAPFLDNVYPQLYNLSAPYIYTLASAPAAAGKDFLELLSLTPYIPGTGTISFSPSSPTVTGVGTTFVSELASSGLNTNSPIGFIDSSGVQQCAAPNSDPRYPDTPTYVACGGKVTGVADNTHFNLTPNPTSTQNNVSWLYVENEINYREYYLTSEMVSGIFLMFSGESNFFGQWTLDQFMNFVISFYDQGQTYSLYYQNPASSSSPIPLPNQFAIFTYEQITGQAAGAPSPSWFPNPNS